MMDFSGIQKEFNPGINFPNFLTRNRLLHGIARFSPLLKGKMMDFGCGAKPYQSLFTVDQYVGVDYESPGHPHVNEEIDVYYDGLHIPFGNDHFDSVFTSEVFEHIFNPYEIIKEIIEARIKQGLTQEDLAKSIGTRQSNISRLEAGEANPSLRFLKKLATGLGKELHISFR